MNLATYVIFLLMVVSILFSSVLLLEFENNNIPILQEKLGLKIITAYSSTLPDFNDEFEDVGQYTLDEGDLSPNGKWQNLYNGYGSSGVQKEDDNNVFFMYPQIPEKVINTHANLVVTTQQFSNFELSLDVKTERQLRENDAPNPWEVAWIFFRYTDEFHYYWFAVKPNGMEFGKKNCNNCTDFDQGQIFLLTDSEPQTKIGKWSKWIIKVVDNRIIINVNGNKVVDFIDVNITEQLSRGKVGLYNEDAYAKFDNVTIKGLPES